MNRRMKISTLFLFFLFLIGIMSIKDVKGATTETVRVDYVFTNRIISDGVCYWSAGLGGGGGLICTYDDFANYSFGVELFTPRNYGEKFGEVTNVDLINLTLNLWDIETDSNIISENYRLFNFTYLPDAIPNAFIPSNYDWNWSDHNIYVGFDNPILESLPAVNELIYNETFENYLAIRDIQYYTHYSDASYYQQAYNFVFRLEIELDIANAMSVDFHVVYYADITYEDGGWGDFTSSMITFVSVILVYILLIWIFGSQYGFLGGGFACIICGAIFYSQTANNPATYPHVAIIFGLAIIFFLAEYKKRQLGYKTISVNTE